MIHAHKANPEKDVGHIRTLMLTEDEMLEWHHWFNGHEFEQTPRDSEGQRNLACHSPWGHKKSEWLSNWTPPQYNIQGRNQW